MKLSESVSDKGHCRKCYKLVELLARILRFERSSTQFSSVQTQRVVALQFLLQRVNC